MFELTRVTSDRPVTKVFSKLGDGSLETISNGHITKAIIKRTTVENLQQLGLELKSLTKNECLIYGVTDHSVKEIIPEKDWEAQGRPAGKAPRKAELYKFPDKGVMFFDFDVQKDGSGNQDIEQIYKTFIDAVPELAGVEILAAPSTGSFIYDGKIQKKGLSGVHFYILVDNASEIPLIGELINQRLWSKGHGHYLVTENGSLVEKGYFDKSAWETNRIDFCAGAICRDGLEQRNSAPILLNKGSKSFNPKQLFDVGLTDEVNELAKAHKTIARKSKEPLAAQTREYWKKGRKEALKAKYPDLNEGELEQIVEQATGTHALNPEWEIKLKTRSEGIIYLTVQEALESPDKYHGADCFDPIEPDYRGNSPVAKLYLDGIPHIHSFAHGGATFQLLEKRDYSEFASDLGTKPAQLFTSLREAIKNLKAIDWQIDKMIKQGTLALIHADAGEGKTYYAIEMGMCIATGLPLWGDFAVKQGNVLYVANEDRDGVTRRAACWEFAKNNGNEVKTFYVCNAPLVFVTDEKSDDSIYAAVKWIEESRVIPGVVFIDTFVDALGEAKENESDSMAKLFKVADDALVRRYGCSVIFIHHNSKSGDVRGSTAIRGKMDHIFTIKQYSPNKFRIENEKNKHGPKNEDYKLTGRLVEFDLPGGEKDSNLVIDLDTTKPHPDGLDFAGQLIVSVLESQFGLNAKVQKGDLRARLAEKKLTIDKANLKRYLEPLVNKGFIHVETRTVELLKRETVVDFDINNPNPSKSSSSQSHQHCDL